MKNEFFWWKVQMCVPCLIFHSFFRYDPDILLGYEIQMHSWGYLLQRAAALSVNLCQMISRVPGMKHCESCVVLQGKLQSK